MQVKSESHGKSKSRVKINVTVNIFLRSKEKNFARVTKEEQEEQKVQIDYEHCRQMSHRQHITCTAWWQKSELSPHPLIGSVGKLQGWFIIIIDRNEFKTRGKFLGNFITPDHLTRVSKLLHNFGVQSVHVFTFTEKKYETCFM